MACSALAAWPARRLTSYLLAIGVAPRLQLFGVCGGIAIVAFIASRGMLETHAASGEAGEKAHFAWPKGLLLIIGILIFAGMTAEGVMYDWSVLYLKQDVGMPQAQAALGYATFSAAMALSRFGGDFLRSRYSEQAVLRFGATVSAVAMAVVLISANPVVAFIGFALVGAGLAPVAPILFNAATRVPGVSRAAAIASVTSIGYSGFMIGPPLIGSIATATSLTMALGVVVRGLGISGLWRPLRAAEAGLSDPSDRRTLVRRIHEADAPEQADLVRVERVAAMHRLRVVPHQHIADPPPVLVDEFGLDGMRTQRREQLVAFGVRDNPRRGRYARDS